MKVDQSGRAFITRQEGEILHTYKCSAGVNTIGVGHTGPGATPGRVISHEQSQQLLSHDLARFEAAVNRLVKVKLSQNQFNALVSFAFNLGEWALAKSSLLNLINASADRYAISAAWRLWDKVNGQHNAGILNRRLREASLYFSLF